MHFQFDVSTMSFPTLHSAPTSGIPDLLSQMLEVEREQLAQLRTFVASHDGGARWRAFLERWRQDFADLPQACKQALPVLEKSYGKFRWQVLARGRDIRPVLLSDLPAGWTIDVDPASVL